MNVVIAVAWWKFKGASVKNFLGRWLGTFAPLRASRRLANLAADDDDSGCRCGIYIAHISPVSSTLNLSFSKRFVNCRSVPESRLFRWRVSLPIRFNAFQHKKSKPNVLLSVIIYFDSEKIFIYQGVIRFEKFAANSLIKLNLTVRSNYKNIDGV